MSNASRIPDLAARAGRYLAKGPLVMPGCTREDCDFGLEEHRLFRETSVDVLDLSDLMEVGVLLTRTLAVQVNADHKLYWAWVGSLADRPSSSPSCFDHNWQNTFRALINAMLVAPVSRGSGDGYSGMNGHGHHIVFDKYVLGAPLAFAVLEGLLRRRCSTWVGIDGTVLQPFVVGNTTYTPKRHLNRIGDSLRLLEKHEYNRRGFDCPPLKQFKTEIGILYSHSGDAIDLIDEWRNEFLHGEDFWINRTAVIVTLTCLLWLDSLEAAAFAELRTAYLTRLKYRPRELFASRHYFDLYPPDLRAT